MAFETRGALVRRVCAVASGAVLALLGLSAPALAASPYPDISITSTIENNYSYSVGNGPLVTVDPALGDVRLRVGANDGGNLSEIGLDLTSKLDGDNFLYLHNGYCVGTCSVSIYTKLTFELTNTGTEARSIRWDSLITPGHLAQVGQDGSGLFHFIIVDGNETESTVANQYDSRGETFGWYNAIDLDEPLSGYRTDVYSEGAGHFNARAYTDWSATPVNFNLLSIAGGTTTMLIYYSSIEMANTAACTDLATCTGVQVAFGDPRNSGEIKNFAAFASAAADPAEPYIGREFGVYKNTASFVTPDTPLPTAPPILPPVTYTTVFTSQQAVPEPASWTMLILGFGMIGFVMRRRQTAMAVGFG